MMCLPGIHHFASLSAPTLLQQMPVHICHSIFLEVKLEVKQHNSLIYYKFRRISCKSILSIIYHPSFHIFSTSHFSTPYPLSVWGCHFHSFLSYHHVIHILYHPLLFLFFLNTYLISCCFTPSIEKFNSQQQPPLFVFQHRMRTC